MKVFNNGGEEIRKDAKKELDALRLLDSPFTVKLYHAFRHGKKLCFIMNLLGGVYLGWDWPKKKKMEEKEARIFLGAMVLGVEHIHSKGVVHHDMHSANYNYDDRGYPILIDFGCA